MMRGFFHVTSDIVLYPPSHHLTVRRLFVGIFFRSESRLEKYRNPAAVGTCFRTSVSNQHFLDRHRIFRWNLSVCCTSAFVVDPGILLQIPLASVTDFHSDGLPLLSIQQLGWNLCTHSHSWGMVLLPLQNSGNTYRIFPAVQISVSDHRPALREIWPETDHYLQYAFCLLLVWLCHNQIFNPAVFRQQGRIRIHGFRPLPGLSSVSAQLFSRIWIE